jgi:hypothetical protein
MSRSLQAASKVPAARPRRLPGARTAISSLLLLAAAAPGLAQLTPAPGNPFVPRSHPQGDYGDAPDGELARYPAPFATVIGNFPTRYNTSNSRYGRPGAYTKKTGQEVLGVKVTAERGARDPSDPDNIENLVDDDFDDGWVTGPCAVGAPGVPFPNPLSVTFSFTVTIAPGAPAGTRYLNLLMDVNHDGVWSGEWLVRDMPVTVAPGTSAVVTTPPVALNWTTAGGWTRVALTRSAITGTFTDDGSGWDGSGVFEYGEIEDYQPEFALAYAQDAAYAADLAWQFRAAAQSAADHAYDFAIDADIATDFAEDFDLAIDAEHVWVLDVEADFDIDLAVRYAQAAQSAHAQAAQSAAYSMTASQEANDYAQDTLNVCVSVQSTAAAFAGICVSCPCATVCALAGAAAQASVDVCAHVSASASASAAATATASANATAYASAAASAYASASAIAAAYAAALAIADAEATAIGLAAALAESSASAAALAAAEADAHATASAAAVASATAAATASSNAAALALAAACDGDAAAAASAAAAAYAHASAAASAWATADAHASAAASAVAVALAEADAAAIAVAEVLVRARAFAAAYADASAQASASAAAAASAQASAGAAAGAYATAQASANATAEAKLAVDALLTALTAQYAAAFAACNDDCCPPCPPCPVITPSGHGTQDGRSGMSNERNTEPTRATSWVLVGFWGTGGTITGIRWRSVDQNPANFSGMADIGMWDARVVDCGGANDDNAMLMQQYVPCQRQPVLNSDGTQQMLFGLPVFEYTAHMPLQQPPGRVYFGARPILNGPGQSFMLTAQRDMEDEPPHFQSSFFNVPQSIPTCEEAALGQDTSFALSLLRGEALQAPPGDGPAEHEASIEPSGDGSQTDPVFLPPLGSVPTRTPLGNP